MTRAHAARELLKHGALTFAEFVDVIGWRAGRTARHTLEHLIRKGDVRMIRLNRRWCYVSAEASGSTT